MQEIIFWTIRVLMIALSICIVRLVWIESGQAFEQEWRETKKQLFQQLVSMKDTVSWK